MIDRAFAEVLRRLRKETGLSQEAFGSKVGLHRTYVSQLERAIKSPSLRTVQKISRVLGLSLAELMTLVQQEMEDAPPECR